MPELYKKIVLPIIKIINNYNPTNNTDILLKYFEKYDILILK